MSQSAVRIIADVGGTNCTFARSDANGALIEQSVNTLACSRFDSFEQALRLYHSYAENIQSLIIGIAGPVVDGTCRATNLPWQLDSFAIKNSFGAQQCILLNDMAIQLHGLAQLNPSGKHTLQSGQPSGTTTALIAVGTGLGEGWMVQHEGSLVVGESEGSHADFGPRNEIQSELLAFIRSSHGHVSWERVVSGSFGFANIYRFLTKRGLPCNGEVDLNLKDHEFGPHVIAAAQNGCKRSESAIEIFVSCLGAEAGNLALKLKSTRGLYISGGVTQHLLPWLPKRSWFLDAFCDKGRFSEFMRSIPVHIVLDKFLPLRGAAIVAKLEDRSC